MNEEARFAREQDAVGRFIEIVRRMGFSDWKIEADRWGEGALVLAISYDALSTAPGLARTRQQFRVALNAMRVEMMSPEEMVQCVREKLHEIACHEIDERLTLDGQTPFHPHEVKPDWQRTFVRDILMSPGPTPSEKG